MAGFTETALVKKLAELNNSQQSIQTLSLWLIHHRKHNQTIVKVWYKELVKAADTRKIIFMFLANDVIQNSKKKGPEFGREFGTVLKKAFENLGASGDEKIKRNVDRLLQVWDERGIYDLRTLKEFKKAFLSENTKDAPPPKKKIRVVEMKPEVKREKIQLVKPENTVEVKLEDGSKEVHIKLSPRTPAFDPPEPEELIKAILDLENSASSDAAVREKIANLPPEVSELSHLAKLQDKQAALNLAAIVNEAVRILSEYNGRLAAEMEDRKKLTMMLHDFLQAQRDLLQQAQERLVEYTDKLRQVHAVRQEMNSHLQNLPDMKQLPDVTGGLAPLPSAGDLFKK